MTPQALDAAAALRLAGPHAALSHETAARAHGIDLVEPGHERLTVARNRSRLTVPGWHVVRADLSGADLDVVEGFRCTSPERTVVDLSRELPFVEAVVAADSAIRQRLLFAADLALRLSTARGRCAAAVRAVGAAIDPRSESVLETMLRLVLRAAGLHPRTQHVIRDGRRFVARVDFCWPKQRLVVEADGFAFHADRAAYRRDRERQNDLERLGWRVLRFTWEDVQRRPGYVVALVQECLDAAAA